MTGRILFLDVDGVLNTLDEQGHLTTFPCPGDNPPYVVDRNRVAMINHVFSQLDDTKLVVSSTWREPDPLNNYYVDSLEDFCKVTGLKPDIFHVDWRTPKHGRGLNRINEIMAWLADHPDTFKACALDDNFADQFEDSPVRLFLTDPAVGMTLTDLVAVLRYFRVTVNRAHEIIHLGGF